MDTTEVGIKTIFNDAPSKALAPMNVTEVGMKTATSVMQFLNAASRMTCTSSGIAMLPSTPQSRHVPQGK